MFFAANRSPATDRLALLFAVVDRSYLPNVKCEVGMLLVLAGMAPIYWQARWRATRQAAEPRRREGARGIATAFAKNAENVGAGFLSLRQLIPVNVSPESAGLCRTRGFAGSRASGCELL